jgi:hypothetical protein
MRRTKRKWKRKENPLYDREIFTVLHMIRINNISDKDIELNTGITRQTLKNWRLGYQNGGTRYPANWRLTAVAEFCGFKKIWVDSSVQDLSKAIPFEPPESEMKPPKKKKNKKKKEVQRSTELVLIEGGKKVA